MLYFFHPKIIILLIATLFFLIVYFLLDDEHFSGVNFVKETIKKEVIKKKITSEIKKQPNTSTEPMTDIDASPSSKYMQYDSSAKTDAAIADATKEVSTDVKKDDNVADTINVSLSQRLFDRAYFSMNTSCLLGYGDIYPVTNTAKIITMLQSLITVSIIVY
jgi:hypothetical protein